MTESERIDSSNPLKIQGSSLPNSFGGELRWKTRQEPNQWIQWQSFKFIIVCSFGKLFVRASAKARPYRIVVVPGEPSALDADATGKEALDGDRPPPRCLDEWIDRTPRARSEQREADRLFPGGQRAETSPDESIGERALGVLRVCVESVFASAYRPKA